LSDRHFSFTYRGEGEQRLDKFLVTCLPDFSRSRLQGLIQEGFVQVDQQVVVKAGYLLGEGQQGDIRIPPPVSSELIPEAIPLEIVFENDDLMVVNKPAGMVVHPAVGHFSGTLIHAALAHAPDLEGVGGEQRPGVVHRLDKDTSGLILLAKNDATHQWLQNQFRLRRVKKVYLALVDGQPPTPTGRVEAPIGRDPAHRKRMAIVPPGKGREAVTEFYTVQNYRQHTLLEARPLTGRTHQIRIHMAFLGCPIVGDTLYGHKHATLPIERHFLHAARLTVHLPGQKEPSTFEAPLPPELQVVLDRLE
jgi:23S rRNA pseudouridine1911/1915/1917 synthase